MQKSEFISMVSTCSIIPVTGQKMLLCDNCSMYSLLFVNTGKIQLYVNGKCFFLNKSEYIVIKPASNFQYVSSENLESEIILFQFSSDNTHINYFTDLVFSSNKEQLLILKKTITDMQYSINSQTNSKEIMIEKIVKEIIINNLNQFFLEGKRLFIYSTNMQSGYLVSEPQNYWERYNAKNRHYLEILNNADLAQRNNNSYEMSKAEEIAEFINKNYTSNITLDDIVRHFSFSKTYICRIFKNHFSKTILEYEKDLKMQQAMELLLKREYSITQISDMLNFSSVHFFSSSFKNYFGISPKKFILQKEIKE